MRKTLWTLLVGLSILPAMGQVFNCSNNFVSGGGGSCGVSLIGGGGDAFAIVGSGYVTAPYVNGSGQVDLWPTGAGHGAVGLNYTAAVNVQAFTANFTFQNNAWGFAFVLQNNTVTTAAGTTHNFFAGAGCENGFYQAFGTSNIPPNYIFALSLDSINFLNGSSFQYSNSQIYQQAESPCNPNDSQPNFWITNRVSTSPVPMNSPASTVNTCFQTVSGTCDTYSVTLTYDGTNFTEKLFDVTAGGTCSPTTSGSCFSQTWNNVNIPSMVNGNAAWVGLTTGSSGSTATAYDIIVKSFEYTVNSPPATPSLSTYTTSATMGASPVVANPTASPAAGSYASAQSVTLSDSTTNSYICYALSITAPSIMPYPDNAGNCPNGTLYTSPVTVSATQNLYYVAGISYTHGSSGALPSNVNEAAYTITGGGAASRPTFSPVTGTYTGPQSVTLSTSSSGAVICYNTTGTPATNGSTGCTTGTPYSGPVTVSSSETLYAVAGGTGYSDSSVGSASYVITSSARAAISGKIVVTGKTVVQ